MTEARRGAGEGEGREEEGRERRQHPWLYFLHLFKIRLTTRLPAGYNVVYTCNIHDNTYSDAPLFLFSSSPPASLHTFLYKFRQNRLSSGERTSFSSFLYCCKSHFQSFPLSPHNDLPIQINRLLIILFAFPASLSPSFPRSLPPSLPSSLSSPPLKPS